jgi:hypothetical protein
MGEIRSAYKILVRKPEGNRPFESVGVYLRIIFKMSLQKCGRIMMARFIWLMMETIGGLLSIR